MFRDSVLKFSLHNARFLTRMIGFPTDDLTGKASNPSKYSWDPNARLAPGRNVSSQLTKSRTPCRSSVKKAASISQSGSALLTPLYEMYVANPSLSLKSDFVQTFQKSNYIIAENETETLDRNWTTKKIKT